MLFEQGGQSLSEDNSADAGAFAELELAPELCRALSGLGYEEPTPIQRAAIPPLLAGRDFVLVLTSPAQSNTAFVKNNAATGCTATGNVDGNDQPIVINYVNN